MTYRLLTGRLPNEKAACRNLPERLRGWEDFIQAALEEPVANRPASAQQALELLNGYGLYGKSRILVQSAVPGAAPATVRVGRKPAPAEPRTPLPGQAWVSPSNGMEFAWIKALGIWMGRYPVTHGEYSQCRPHYECVVYRERYRFDDDRQPVVVVNFEDGRDYAAWLTDRDHARLAGLRYRLPSEREWMVCAQCGDGREYPWGNHWPPLSGQAGNYHGEEGAEDWGKIAGYNDGHPVTCVVEQSWANPWGLYGMGGNVWEACASDSRGGIFGAWRGGSWSNHRRCCLRCSARIAVDASGRDFNSGFRLALAAAWF